MLIFLFQDPDIVLNVKLLGTEHQLIGSNDGEMLSFRLTIDKEDYLVNVTPYQAEKGTVVNIKCKCSAKCIPVEVKSIKNDKDDLQDYVVQFLQWFFLIISMKDAIKEGDMQRNNVNLKMCIPMFYSHSNLSKYMEECIDYILKTEVMLPEQMALKVKAASFVNMSGRKGENKAADLQKENEVCVLKELIRGLGANKIEKAIITISKAAPVIQQVVDNIDNMLNVRDKRTTHKKKSFESDVQILLKELANLNIWNLQNRQLTSFPDISPSPFSFFRSGFRHTTMTMVKRLRRGAILPEVESEETDSD